VRGQARSEMSYGQRCTWTGHVPAVPGRRRWVGGEGLSLLRGIQHGGEGEDGAPVADGDGGGAGFFHGGGEFGGAEAVGGVEVEGVVFEGEGFGGGGFFVEGLEGGFVGRGLAEGGVEGLGVGGGGEGVRVVLDEVSELVVGEEEEFGGEAELFLEGGGDFGRDGFGGTGGGEEDVAGLDVGLDVFVAEGLVEGAEGFHFDGVVAGDVEASVEGDELGHEGMIADGCDF
jgi:hypothetical protein